MMRRWMGRVGVVLAGLLASASPALGQVRAVSVSVDNDGFAFWIPRVTDWYYTNGADLEVTGDWKLDGIATLGIHGDACADATPGRPCVVTHFALGQKMFTPENLFFYRPGVVDRPYAGWLYTEMRRERLAPHRTTSVSVQVGVTGDPSLARWIQDTFHEMIGHTSPQGWQYQIPFEVDFAGTYRDSWHLSLTRSGRPLSFDVEPGWAATLGTLRTSAQAGLFLRLGWKDPVGWGLRGPSPRPFHAEARLGSDGEWVLRDLFLDGGTWRTSARTAKKPLVGRTRAEIALGWDKIDIDLAATRSTRDFRAQDVPHLYGTVSVRVRR